MKRDIEYYLKSTHAFLSNMHIFHGIASFKHDWNQTWIWLYNSFRKHKLKFSSFKLFIVYISDMKMGWRRISSGGLQSCVTKDLYTNMMLRWYWMIVSNVQKGWVISRLHLHLYYMTACNNITIICTIHLPHFFLFPILILNWWMGHLNNLFCLLTRGKRQTKMRDLTIDQNSRQPWGENSFVSQILSLLEPKIDIWIDYKWIEKMQ